MNHIWKRIGGTYSWECKNCKSMVDARYKPMERMLVPMYFDEFDNLGAPHNGTCAEVIVYKVHNS